MNQQLLGSLLEQFMDYTNGMRLPGNIDLYNRPVVHNPDGSISTVHSASIGTDRGEVSIPQVAEDGSRLLSQAEAEEQFRRTRKHLGIFDTPENATAHNQALHKQQEYLYPNPTGDQSTTAAILEAQEAESQRRMTHDVSANATPVDPGAILKNSLLEGLADIPDIAYQASQGPWAPMMPHISTSPTPTNDYLREQGITQDDPEGSGAGLAFLARMAPSALLPVPGSPTAKVGGKIAERLGTALEEAGTGMSPLAKQHGMFMPASPKKVAQAEAMARDGATREEIWDKLLMARGPEGKWRTEIDDSKARLNPKGWRDGQANLFSTPGEVFKHDALYSADPGIKNDVTLRNMRYGPEQKTEGSYTPDYREISVQADSPQKMLSYSLHELQHDIQKRGGFARGGNPSEGITGAFEAYRRLAGEAEARNVQTRLDWTPEQRRATPPWKYPESLDVPESELIVRQGGGTQAAIEKPPPEVTPALRERRATEQDYLPVTLYHGTVHKPGERATGIEAFDPKRMGKRTDTGWYGEGVYTTVDPEIAGTLYADPKATGAPGGTVYPVRARVKNPFTYTKVEGGYPEAYEARRLEEAKTRSTLNAMKGWTMRERALINGEGGGINLESITARVGSKRMREVLKANGHDGVVVNLHDPKYPENSQPYHEVVAFDPAQIRSIHADFDPKKRQSKDLLASLLLGSVGLPLMMQAAQNQDAN